MEADYYKAEHFAYDYPKLFRKLRRYKGELSNLLGDKPFSIFDNKDGTANFGFTDVCSIKFLILSFRYDLKITKTFIDDVLFLSAKDESGIIFIGESDNKQTFKWKPFNGE